MKIDDIKGFTPQKPIALSSEKKTISSYFRHNRGVPYGDSPYAKAKQVQIIERNPNKAVSLFLFAINSGDRVDSALKDMAGLMSQLNRADEAIQAIKSLRHLCSKEAQESLDDLLIDLYKKAGKFDVQIKLLKRKLLLVQVGALARYHGKHYLRSIEHEKSNLFGSLGWAYLQKDEYQLAEQLYRKAIDIEGYNRCNQFTLAICLIHQGKLTEAKKILKNFKPSILDLKLGLSYVKAFDRATKLLSELYPGSEITECDEQRPRKSRWDERP